VPDRMSVADIATLLETVKVAARATAVVVEDQPLATLRATLGGFEASLVAAPADLPREVLDVTVYAKSAPLAARALGRVLTLRLKEGKTKERRTATPLGVGDEGDVPRSLGLARGRKALVCLPFDRERSIVITQPAKPQRSKPGANAWEFHGNEGAFVPSAPPGVRHDDGWAEITLGKPFDDVNPATLRGKQDARSKAAYRQGYQSKLGGYPYFPQSTLEVACFECSEPMTFVAQLGDSVADFMADWLLYVFACPKGCEVKVASQS